MKAYQHFNKAFEKSNLARVFEENVVKSSAVGRDGIRKHVFEQRLDFEIDLILSKVHNQSYRFTGFKEKLISKGPTKTPRQLSIPTFRDRLTLRVLCDILSAVFHEAKTRPPHEYIKNIKTCLLTADSSYCFLRMDIKQYYPSIQHQTLISRMRSRIRKAHIIDLVISAIRTPTGKKNSDSNANEVGVPQGLSISNILSSIYLRHLDAKYKKGFIYFRYVDDILVICKQKESGKIYRQLKRELKKIGLECHDLEGGDYGKTSITTLDAGVDYLGFNITNEKVSVRASSYRRMFSNLLKVFTSYKYSKNKDRLLWRLNLKITGCVMNGQRRGWMFFFSQSDNKQQLKRLDKFVRDLLKQYKLEDLAGEVKTFTKAYFEIRFNVKKTTYIPDFETYSLQQKIELICLLTKYNDPVIIKTWSLETIEAEFTKCASKEVAYLEKDLLEVFS